MDRNIVPTAALNWLITVINEGGGKKRDEMFTWIHAWSHVGLHPDE